MSDFNFNEVVIDRVHRIHEYDLNGKRLWTMNQVKDFKLTLGGETVYAQDAQGVNIMAFDKSKTAEADWSNALMHLGALAEQMGSKKEVASSEAKQVFTTVEYLTSADGKKLTLTHAPKTAVANAPFKYIDLVECLHGITVYCEYTMFLPHHNIIILQFLDGSFRQFYRTGQLIRNHAQSTWAECFCFGNHAP